MRQALIFAKLFNMKKAILIHGWSNKEDYFNMNNPSESNNHWFPWLQKNLIVKGFDCQTPEMPNGYEPNYEIWKQTFENLKPDESTVLVGHSCGGGFLARWLSENSAKVGKVILVAPWLDPQKNSIDPDFFNFEIDENILKKTDGLTIIYSDNDYEDVMKSVEILKDKLKGVKLLELKGKGHFINSSLGTSEFPELLNAITFSE